MVSLHLSKTQVFGYPANRAANPRSARGYLLE
jgi:hypothetical protein